jgi:hypothetical protein
MQSGSHEGRTTLESIHVDDEPLGNGGVHRRGALAADPKNPGAEAGPATATGQGDADACMALPIAEHLAEAAARLVGVPAKLLGCDCLTASIYVEAATRSLLYAAEVIRTDASRQMSQTDDDDIDPRLLEWLS